VAHVEKEKLMEDKQKVKNKKCKKIIEEVEAVVEALTSLIVTSKSFLLITVPFSLTYKHSAYFRKASISTLPFPC
jgi:hypothetical protein